MSGLILISATIRDNSSTPEMKHGISTLLRGEHQFLNIEVADYLTKVQNQISSLHNQNNDTEACNIITHLVELITIFEKVQDIYRMDDMLEFANKQFNDFNHGKLDPSPLGNSRFNIHLSVSKQEF